VRTSTITLPPFRGGRGGVFDVPKEKCPPDIPEGRFDQVTVGRPQYTPPTPSPSPPNYSHSLAHKRIQSQPIKIPSRPTPLPSPPKTPSPLASKTSPLTARSDTLELLSRLFPRSAMSLLPHSRGVQIFSSVEGMSVRWDGAVLAVPGNDRGLYVDAGTVENVQLKECIVALLELADEHLHCTSLVIALSKSSPDLGDILHALMYVGGTVVSRPPFPVAKGYILVGISLC